MNVLSLFDGISCGQIALNRIGITPENYYASEVDKYAITVTQANFPNTIQLGDVTKWREWDIDWSDLAIPMLIEQKADNPTLTGRVAVRCVFHFKNKVRRDIHNYVKGLFDACTKAGIWEDDSQIDQGHEYRGDICKNDYVEMEIWEIE